MIRQWQSRDQEYLWLADVADSWAAELARLGRNREANPERILSDMHIASVNHELVTTQRALGNQVRHYATRKSLRKYFRKKGEKPKF